MGAVIAFLTSKAGIAALLGIGLLLLFGIQEGRLKLAQHGEKDARAEVAKCSAKLATQNAAIAAQAAKSAAVMASNEKVVKQAAPRVRHYVQMADQIHDAGVGAQCSRWEDVDAEVRGAFQ